MNEIKNVRRSYFSKLCVCFRSTGTFSVDGITSDEVNHLMATAYLAHPTLDVLPCSISRFPNVEDAAHQTAISKLQTTEVSTNHRVHLVGMRSMPFPNSPLMQAGLSFYPSSNASSPSVIMTLSSHSSRLTVTVSSLSSAIRPIGCQWSLLVSVPTL